jgi:transmembrane sensor
MSPRRIHIDVPADEVQRERIEHRVFQQLARMQAAAIYEPPPALVLWTRRWRAGVAMAVAAGLVAIVLILVWSGREGSGPAPDVFTSVQTPVGGSSRFTVASAVIDAGSDTSVSVHRGERGVSLMLKHGSVSCEVAHQDGRVFRVVAGEVEVEVVGTRFTVTRTGAAVYVEVARGKVRVRTRSEERMLTVGESWTVATEPRAETAEAGAAARPATSAAEASEAEQGDASELAPPSPSVTLPVPPSVTPPVAPARPEPKLSRREAFAVAQALESTNARRAAAAYRKIANGKDAWAAVALYSLAELQTTEDRDKALRTLDELARRFPTSENVEDALWLRTETLRGAGRRVEARGVAAEYLRKYPQGTYAKPAARLLKSP